MCMDMQCSIHTQLWNKCNYVKIYKYSVQIYLYLRGDCVSGKRKNRKLFIIDEILKTGISFMN